MFIFLSYSLISIWLTVFISIHSFEPLIESAYVPERIYEEQQVYNGNRFHEKFHKLYNTSKHVFYWLYTSDETDGQLLNRSETRMIESTTYDLGNPMKVIVHGWLGTTQEKEGLCSINIKSYFKVGNYNVICVDWKQYSTDISYAVAKARAKHIAKDIANVLSRITNNMTEGMEDMHLIGHSMGAHIVGFVGKRLTNLIPRITGLDPARPMYEKSDPEDRINQTDAQFVDIIHTNGDKNGLFKCLGHIDFYPNGGKSQPNCGKMDKSTGSCSHIKSYHYFAHSIWAKEDYVAQNCSSWDDYNEKKCNDEDTTFMGEHVDKTQEGTYYLETKGNDPYEMTNAFDHSS